MKTGKSKINGLVLAGGKSSRMGQDKSALRWHGCQQLYYVADLLAPFCTEVFISRRKEQGDGLDIGYKILVDSYEGIGPYGAILSAFEFRPDQAWLVVACDLPLLDHDTLSYLLEKREEKKMATTFQSPYDGLPESLITIWEPKSYPLLLTYLSNGFTCPRKVLIKADDSHILQPPNPDALLNVNTPEERAKAEQLINKNYNPIN
jgi:molybdopterin-guanine dinucleotide biosynthesis protein A